MMLVTAFAVIAVLVAVVIALYSRVQLLNQALSIANARHTMTEQRMEQANVQQTHLNAVVQQQTEDLKHVQANLSERNDFNTDQL